MKSNNITYMELATLISKGAICHISHIFLNGEGKDRIDIYTGFEEIQKTEHPNERNVYKVYDVLEMAWEHDFSYMCINDQLMLSRNDIEKLYIDSNKEIKVRRP